MKYMGGKAKIARELSWHINGDTCKGLPYWEPFVGSGAILAEVRSIRRIASDKCRALIMMYAALQKGWVPPEELSEEEYAILQKAKDDDDPMTAFAGFGCSFGGKWFGGYARAGKNAPDPSRGYAREAHNTLLKWLKKVRDVEFYAKDYKTLDPEGYVIYCDPPYKNTTGYGATGKFDTDEFWEWVRARAQTNVVFVSEYDAPDDVPLVEEVSKAFSMSVTAKNQKRIERLYRLAPPAS